MSSKKLSDKEREILESDRDSYRKNLASGVAPRSEKDHYK